MAYGWLVLLSSVLLSTEPRANFAGPGFRDPCQLYLLCTGVLDHDSRYHDSEAQDLRVVGTFAYPVWHTYDFEAYSDSA
jgi:hypothetical protein